MECKACTGVYVNSRGSIRKEPCDFRFLGKCIMDYTPMPESYDRRAEEDADGEGCNSFVDGKCISGFEPCNSCPHDIDIEEECVYE